MLQFETGMLMMTKMEITKILETNYMLVVIFILTGKVKVEIEIDDKLVSCCYGDVENTFEQYLNGFIFESEKSTIFVVNRNVYLGTLGSRLFRSGYLDVDLTILMNRAHTFCQKIFPDEYAKSNKFQKDGFRILVEGMPDGVLDQYMGFWEISEERLIDVLKESAKWFGPWRKR